MVRRDKRIRLIRLYPSALVACFIFIVSAFQLCWNLFYRLAPQWCSSLASLSFLIRFMPISKGVAGLAVTCVISYSPHGWLWLLAYGVVTTWKKGD